MQLAKWAALLAAISLGVAAHAQDSGSGKLPGHLYVGGGYGLSHWDPGCPGTANPCDENDNSLRAFAGWQLNKTFAGEVAFTNLGKATGPNMEAKGHAWEASLLAGWPVFGAASVYGRLGAYRGVVKGGGVFASRTETNYYLTYGVGAQVDFMQNLAARLEWQAFPGVAGSSITDSDVHVVMLSALWRFR